MSKRIVPNKNERGNGWDAARLNDYVEQRNRAAGLKIYGEPSEKQHRPLRVENVRGWNPHNWKRG